MTLGDLKNRIKKIEATLVVEDKFSQEDVDNMPIYLGDDEELNGIHYCEYIQDVDLNDENWEDIGQQVDYAIKDKYILIS